MSHMLLLSNLYVKTTVNKDFDYRDENLLKEGFISYSEIASTICGD